MHLPVDDNADALIVEDRLNIDGILKFNRCLILLIIIKNWDFNKSNVSSCDMIVVNRLQVRFICYSIKRRI